MKPPEDGKQGDPAIVYDPLCIFKRLLWLQCGEWAEGRQAAAAGDGPRAAGISSREMAELGRGKAVS